MKKLIKQFLPKKLITKLSILHCEYFGGYAARSYSQEGEDMILRRIFEKQRSGFYLDVGAHHPKRFSNTYFFYRRGWSGINIDAMPGSMVKFNKLRSRDINLEVGVSAKRETLKYYVFNETALNSFSEQLTLERDGVGSYHVVKTIDVAVFPLSEILEKYVGDREVDFMTIDVEGKDLEVLKSNNWERYRPSFVLVECFGTDDVDAVVKNNETVKFMMARGYSMFAKTVNTVFFKRSSK